MKKFEGVANTLFVPLVARIAVSKEFPEYFYDEKALELEKSLPKNVSKGSSQYSNLASVARYYNMDEMVERFVHKNSISNIVYLGAGLETAYDRMQAKLEDQQVNWYEVDLPEVIEAREKVLGEHENETLIAGDMFKLTWISNIDTSLPTLLIVSGVFQYFHEEDIIRFIKKCKEKFENGELIFDATSKGGLIFTNWFIKRTGNKTALMYFYVDDSNGFAVTLLEERTFFKKAFKILGAKLKFFTKVSMKIAERKKQVKILHLKL